MPGIEKICGGYLEKKKDWIRRTQDYREKANKIKKLKRKAKERNPDEFDFHMVRSQVGLDGVHRDLEEDEGKTEVQHLLGDIGDIKYVRYHLGKEKKKVEKLKSDLQFCADDAVDAPKNKHTIFVDDEEEASNFDLAKYFKTSTEFLDRTFNRPRVEQIASSSGAVDSSEFEASEKQRNRLYAELGKRMERAKELEIVLKKLELKKDLAMSKKSKLKPKLIRKSNAHMASIYKWTYERKK